MEYQIKEQDKYRYIEEGNGEPLVLLHGLFGALSNFRNLIEYFRQHNKVVVPMLPLLEMDILHTSVGGLAKFVHKFLEARDLNAVHLMGNSLGGHVGLVHVLKHPERVKSLILTGRLLWMERTPAMPTAMDAAPCSCPAVRPQTSGACAGP